MPYIRTGNVPTLQNRRFTRPGLKLLLPMIWLMGFQSVSGSLAGEPPRLQQKSGLRLQQQIERLVRAESSPAGKDRDGLAQAQDNAGLLGIYRGRAFKPFWLSDGQPTPRAAILRAFLDGAAGEGLRPEDYSAMEIRRLWRQTDDGSRARLELLLTRAFVRYAEDVGRGRVEARRLEDPAFAEAHEAGAIPAAIRKGLETPELERFLRLQAPQHSHYRQLKLALQRYRAIARKGGWKTIPAGPALQTGMADPRIPLIHRRLALTGDTAGANPASTVFDKNLETAVRHFQKRHYLPQDGVVGAETLAAMNLPVEKRIRQIVINLERWRWTSHDLSGKRILVNIPGFELVGLRDERIELAMPVVVGKIDQQTPAFDERMEFIEFNPDWLMPPAIAVSEYLPELQKDPAALARKHIRVFLDAKKDAPEVDPQAISWNRVTPAMMERYALRQAPGPWNALGTVKFMFPNKYNVYFHDTSEPWFFARHKRTYSHGCVRVSRPYELAAWILEGEASSWNPERIRATAACGVHATVPLEKPLPVHLLYRTAWIAEDGSLHFRPDIYGRDAALESSLISSFTALR
jgi:murein L,D-transpeptidase YcbB/YkuD